MALRFAAARGAGSINLSSAGSSAATAADRVQTGLDRAATNADVILTHADVVLTHADVVLTHADVVLTHADVVSAAASASTATTQAGIATTQAGIATTQAGIATTQAGNAATSASGASTSAGTATTQAGIATTQASNAAASAVTATAASAALAFRFTWSSSTSGNPGTGSVAVNNAAPGSATALQISETDASGNSLVSEIARWDDPTNASGKTRLKIAKDATNFLLLTITSAVTDAGAYDTFTVSGASLTGTLANGDVVYVQPTLSGNDGSSSGDMIGANNLAAGAGGVANAAAAFANIKQAATASATGVVELATDAETQTGTDTVRAITPANLTAAARKQGKETIFVPAGAMVPRTTNGAAFGNTELSTNKVMVRTLDFDSSVQEFAQFSVWFPKSWNLGTVTFQPSFSQLTTAAGGVVFGLAGVAVSDGDDLDAAFGTAQTSTKTAGTLNKEYQGPESSAITIAGTPTAGDRVVFQINRTTSDGSDTLGQDARLHGIRLHFTTNAPTDS